MGKTNRNNKTSEKTSQKSEYQGSFINDNRLYGILAHASL